MGFVAFQRSPSPQFRSRYLSPTWLDCARDAAAWWPQATSFTYNCATRYCQLRQGRADNARTSADDLFGVVPTPPVIEGVSTSDNDGSTCTFNTIEQLSPTWWGNELRTAPNGMFAVDWTVCRAQCCKLGAVSLCVLVLSICR